MNAHLHSRVRQQHGAATLVVVMSLFLIVAMLAAFASRNIVYEQRIASNSYRIGVAYETAEAGVEWALAMLNSDRINGACVNNAAGPSDFRSRYLSINQSNRVVSPVIAGSTGVVACIYRGTNDWGCQCPEDGALVMPTLSASGGLQPMFAIGFRASTRPGTAQLVVSGCTGLSSDCGNNLTAAANALSKAEQFVDVALVSAVKMTPVSPLVARGHVYPGSPAALSLFNGAAGSSGLLVQTGQALSVDDLAQAESQPGSLPNDSVITADASIRDATAEAFFASFFGMSSDYYRGQPKMRTVAVTSACGGDCTTPLVSQITAGAQMFWLDKPAHLRLQRDPGVGNQSGRHRGQWRSDDLAAPEDLWPALCARQPDLEQRQRAPGSCDRRRGHRRRHHCQRRRQPGLRRQCHADPEQPAWQFRARAGKLLGGLEMSKRLMSRNQPRHHSRGVTLVEAMVALLIMSFGMLALVGLQANLRRSADVAKQRGEATKLAQVDMEGVRAFGALTTASAPAGTVAYDAIAASANDSAGHLQSNATFTLTREVSASVNPPMTAVDVALRWVDRASEAQTVRLSTFVAGIAPGLSGSVTIGPPDGISSRRPQGRSTDIPTGAKDVGQGHSMFKPDPSGTVAWVFNNLSGEVTNVCTVLPEKLTSELTLGDLAGCGVAKGYLLSGHVRYSTTSPPDPNLPNSAAILPSMVLTVDVPASYPTPAYQCFVRLPTATAAGYYCVVYPQVQRRMERPTRARWYFRDQLQGLPLQRRL